MPHQLQVGILLEYYQRIFSYGGAYKYVSGSSKNAVCGPLIGSGGGPVYLGNKGSYFYASVYGDAATEGMAQYTLNTSYYTAPYRFVYSSSFDYNNIVARIKVNKPAILNLLNGIGGMGGGVTTAHAVVVVGYRTNPNGDQVVVLNDGWGNNQRYVTRDNRYMCEYIYLQ